MHPTFNPTPSAKVFSIPELVHSISCFTELLELARLLQVSHLTFGVLVPVAWKHVHGAHKLLGLIKYASLRYNDTGKLDEIALYPQGGTIQPDLFTRFDLYARHVNSLEIYNDKDHTYGVSGWELLIAEAQRRPLLPNLKKLCKLCRMTNKSFPRGHVETRWISAFVTDSLLEFSPHIEYWKYTATSAVLGTLVRQTTKIEALTFYSRDSIDDVDDPDFGQPSVPHEPWYTHLPALQGLRHLYVTEGWLHLPCLLALGQLPRLEVLKLRPGSLKGFNVMLYSDIDLIPSGTFPALRHLIMLALHPYSTARILGIKQMVKSITELDLELDLEELEDNDEWHRRFIVHVLVPSFKNAPCIRKLGLNVFLPTGANYLIDHPKVMDIIAMLPLETLYLGAMHLGKGALSPNLGNIWPNITSLWMPSQYASLQELSYFAAIPNMRSLMVQLDITTTHTPQNIPSSHAPLELISSTEGNRISTRFEVMEHNARVLHLLWPGIRGVLMPTNQDKQMNTLVSIFDLLLGMRYRIRLKYGDGPVPAMPLMDELLLFMKETCDHIRADVGESRSDSDVSPGVSEP